MKYHKCLMGTIKRQLLHTHLHSLPFVRAAPAHTQVIMRVLQTHHTVPHTHGWAPSRPSSRDHSAPQCSIARGAARDVGQDVFFYAPAKRCHCTIGINWTADAVTHRGLLLHDCQRLSALPSSLAADNIETGAAHERTPAGIFHFSWSAGSVCTRRYALEGECRAKNLHIVRKISCAVTDCDKGLLYFSVVRVNTQPGKLN